MSAINFFPVCHGWHCTQHYCIKCGLSFTLYTGYEPPFGHVYLIVCEKDLIWELMKMRIQMVMTDMHKHICSGFMCFWWCLCIPACSSLQWISRRWTGNCHAFCTLHASTLSEITTSLVSMILKFLTGLFCQVIRSWARSPERKSLGIIGTEFRQVRLPVLPNQQVQSTQLPPQPPPF